MIQPQSYDDHRRALASTLATFRALDEAQWRAPREGDGWSPAQIAEHLRLTYVVTRRELRGGAGMRRRAPWYLAPLLRLRYLGGILRRGQFPAGAPAVREIRPGDEARPRGPLLAELEAEGERMLADAAEADRLGKVTGVTHPFFGKIDLDRGLQLATAHLRHHETQVLEVLEQGAMAATDTPVEVGTGS